MDWQIDQSRSHVGFSVKHMMIATIRGRFTSYRGNVRLDADDFTRSQFDGEIDVASIDTGNRDRDAELRANDFLNIARFPKVSFHSRSIERRGRDTYQVTGDLTVRGVTRPVSLEVAFTGATKPAPGKAVATLRARGTINRKDFGVNLSPLLETGGLAVGTRSS